MFDYDVATSLTSSIAFAYAVLSDPARRKRYDETGSTSESIVDSDGFSWTDFSGIIDDDRREEGDSG